VKILAIEHEQPGVTAGQFQAYRQDEALIAWRLYQEEVIRELYFRADQNTAILVLECEDIAEAESVLATLPLVRAGLIAFELLPLKPYPGFSRLFADE
jgi:hypothetical protein